VALALQRRIDASCRQWEAAWKAGTRPRLEDYLGDTPEPDRAVLLGELLKIEIAYRQRQGEQPHADDYQQRFPDHVELIHSVLNALAVPAVASEAFNIPPHPVPLPVPPPVEPTLQPEWIGK